MKAFAALLAVLIVVPAFGASKFRRSPDRIPNQYLVVFNDSVARIDVPVVAHALAHAHGGAIFSRWSSVIKGFAVTMPETAARALSADPRVAYVEENAQIFLSATQTAAPWHLDRIDQRTGTNGNYHYCTTGGVMVYVVDTGVWAAHSEFSIPGGSKVTFGIDFSEPYDGGTAANPCSGTDNYAAGHGTSVASVLAGNTFGVAKNAGIIPVRVLNCAGEGSAWTIVNGLNWIHDDWNAGNSGTALVTMSIFRRVLPATEPETNAIEQAVQNLLTTGLQVVASANNQNNNACETTPARMAEVVTVAGTTPTDARWVATAPYLPCANPGSNFGPCVKLFAPAQGIRSAHILSAYAERNDTFPGQPQCDARSGTSFSAPIVAGVIARYLSQVGYRSPTQIRQWLYSDSGSTANIVTNQGLGSTRRFVYADAGGVCP